MAQKDPDGDKDDPVQPNNSDNGDDDGQGHQFVMTIGGHTYLYTLTRSVGHIDVTTWAFTFSPRNPGCR